MSNLEDSDLLLGQLPLIFWTVWIWTAEVGIRLSLDMSFIGLAGPQWTDMSIKNTSLYVNIPPGQSGSLEAPEKNLMSQKCGMRGLWLSKLFWNSFLLFMQLRLFLLSLPCPTSIHSHPPPPQVNPHIVVHVPGSWINVSWLIPPPSFIHLDTATLSYVSMLLFLFCLSIDYVH